MRWEADTKALTATSPAPSRLSLGFDLNFGLPACCRHRLFKAQPADDLLDFSVDAVGGGHKGAHGNEPRSFEVVAIEAAQRQTAARKTLQEKGTNVCLILATARDRYQISSFDLCRHQWLPVDEAHDRAQEKVDEYDEACRHRRVKEITSTRQNADRGRAPERRSRVEPADAEALQKEAATRVGLASPGVRAAKMMKVAAPKATKVLVRRPARRLRHCRSNPMTALRARATARLIAACSMGIVIADGSSPIP
jgi:hypothetical protein